MNSFLRPKRSVSCPNSSAPKQAPATYSDAASPATSADEMLIPEPLAEIAPAIEPTIVTSSPSRIQTVPRPIRIFQCQRDHGSRSSRAGMSVSIVPRLWSWSAVTAVIGVTGYPIARLATVRTVPVCIAHTGRRDDDTDEHRGPADRRGHG